MKTSDQGWETLCVFSQGDGKFGNIISDTHDTGSYEGAGTWTRHLTDYNGDGLTDFCIIATGLNPIGWKSKCIPSLGDGYFGTKVDNVHDTINYGGPGTWTRHFIDFNDDGDIDLCMVATGTYPTSWQTSCVEGHGDGTFGPIINEVQDPANYGDVNTWSRDFSDFNNDGKIDLCMVGTGTSPTSWQTSCVMGDGDGTFGSVINQMHDNANVNYGGVPYWTRIPADYNGDGLTDFCIMHSGNTQNGGWESRCVMNKGDGTFGTMILNTHDGTVNYGGPEYWTRLPADYNGDGLTDFCIMLTGLASNGGWESRCVLNNGDTTFGTMVLNAHDNTANYGGSGTWTRVQGDFNGDGLLDICIVLTNDIDGWESRCVLNKNTKPFLLTKVENGLGGSSTIEYSPSTDFSNTLLPFVTQVVTKVTTDDGRGNVSSTDYEYDGGYFHLVDKEFRGFHHAKVTGPAGPNGVRTVNHSYFHQGNDTAVGANDPSDSIGYTKGSVYRQEIRDTAGTFWTITKTQYTPDADGQEPWYTPPQWVEVKVYDGHGGNVTTLTKYFYDAYGNVIEEEQYGDTNTPLDDRTVVQTFDYNLTKRLLSFPTSKTTYEGIGTGRTQVSHADLYYDGTSSCGTASTNQLPTKGLLTRSVNWLDGGTSPETRLAYNAAGNPICTRDANGNTSTMEYDDEEVFEISSTNALGHKVDTKYYGVEGESMTNGLYGQIKEATDPNGAKVSTEYDALGRVIKVTDPEDIVTTTSYLNFGNISSQQVKTDGPLSQTSQVYFDGLGRKYLTKSTGPDNKEIVTETVYDLRGNVWKTSLPFFNIGGVKKWVVIEYDLAGRKTKVTNPDGSFILNCYDDWTSATIDANGHKTRQVRNVFGKPLLVQEFSGTYSSCDPNSTTNVYSETTYEYDVQGKLLKTTDDKGNESILTYNTLSRKIGMDDPDMGVWSYEYDNVGNIVKQTDAKGQVIHFQYDALNRLVQKDYSTQKALGVGDVVYTFDGGTGGGGGGTQTTIEFQEGVEPDSSYNGTRDALLKEASPTTNYGTEVNLESDEGSGTDLKTVLAWDISSIPSGATIDSASISLNIYNGSSGDHVFREVTTTWSESTVDWNDISGNIGTTDLGTIDGGSGTGYKTFNLNSAGIAVIQSWVNGSTNNGFVVQSAGTTDGIRFHSGEVTGTTVRPKLIVTYTTGGGGGGGTPTTVDYKEGVEPDSSYNGTRDALLKEASPTTNYGTEVNLESDEGSGTDLKTVLAWDISSIPSGATIDSASISLNIYNGSSGDHVFREVTTTWSESTVDWNDISGNIGTTDLGTIDGGSGTGYKTFNLNSAGIAVIQSWVNGSTNNGFVVQSAGTTDGIRFHSGEVTGTSLRPQLSITYTTGGGGGGGSVANGIGRLIKVEDGSGSTSFEYDIKGRVIRSDKVVDGQTYTAHSTFDNLGRVKTQTYPDGTVITNIYNGPLLESVSDSTQTFVTYSDFNANGQYEKAEYGNGVTTDYTYDPDNFRLDSMLTQNDHPVVSTFQDLDYFFDSGGNITQITDAVRGNKTYVYDDHDRLTSATHNGINGFSGYGTVTYAYDTIGNMTSNSKNGGTYTYFPSGQGNPTPHAVKTANGVTYSYDANGNMTGDTAGKSMVYDFENRPTQITKGSVVTDFVYDGDGGRVKKTVGSVDTIYIGKSHVCEGGSCIIYIFAGGTRIAQIDAGTGSNAKYFHGDHLGSTSLTTDSGGNNIEDLIYLPYGKVHSDNGPTFNARYKFTGKELDESTDLYFYEARYYDPNLARFITPDAFVQNPFDYESLNRYTYTRNNPIIYTDPSGHFFKALFKGFLAAMIGGPWVGITVAQGEATNWNIGIMAFQQFVAVATAYAGGTGIFSSLGPMGAGIADGAMIGALTGGASALVFQAAGYKVNFWKSLITGAVSGAMSGAIGAKFGKTWDLKRVGVTSIAGGITEELKGGDFLEGFITSFAISITTYFAIEMRKFQVKLSSKLTYDPMSETWGKWNASGDSMGFNGIGPKIAGNRITEYPDGTLDMSQVSPLGGLQGGEGNFIKWSCKSGGFIDYVVEAFSGVHDTLNTPYWYNVRGNNFAYGRLGTFIGEAFSLINVGLAAPVVVSSMIGTSSIPFQSIAKRDR